MPRKLKAISKNPAKKPPVRRFNGKPMLAGFWVRVLADFIDTGLLWLVGLILSIALESVFLKMGGQAPWVGFIISAGYFTLFHSKLGGHTPGKRLLRLQVLSLDGSPLSPARAFLRYLVIGFVFYDSLFFTLLWPALSFDSRLWLGMLASSLWLSVLVGCTLMVPLHPLKRGLHDLLAGSIVLRHGSYRAAAMASLKNPSQARRAYLICGVASVLLVASATAGMRAIEKTQDMDKLERIFNRLQESGTFLDVSATLHIFNPSENKPVRSVNLRVHVPGHFDTTEDDLKAAYDEAFRTVREEMPNIKEYDKINVAMKVGYDIGIRKKFKTMFETEDLKSGERKRVGWHVGY